MTSTGARAENTPENIASREPTDKEMQFISTKEAEKRWGVRVWSINGMTVCSYLAALGRFLEDKKGLRSLRNSSVPHKRPWPIRLALLPLCG